MSHNPNSKSEFNDSIAAGKPTNLNQTHFGISPTANSSTTESSSSAPTTETYTAPNNLLGPAVDLQRGKLGGEHGGSGTRNDDRKGETVQNEGDTVSPVAKSN